MRRTATRILWWLLVYERPAWWGDYAAILVLVGLLIVGALIIAGPWLLEVVPRWAVWLQSTLLAGLERVRGMLPRFG